MNEKLKEIDKLIEELIYIKSDIEYIDWLEKLPELILEEEMFEGGFINHHQRLNQIKIRKNELDITKTQFKRKVKQWK